MIEKVVRHKRIVHLPVPLLDAHAARRRLVGIAKVFLIVLLAISVSRGG